MTAPDEQQNDEIVITAYSKRYTAAFEELLGIEGGFVDDPVDRGGTTKYGISLRFLKTAGDVDEDLDGYADFDLDFDGDIDGRDIRRLTIGDARYLYFEHFWKPLACDSFAVPVGEMLFDQGVNGGNHAARKLLQQAINRVVGTHRYRSIPLRLDGKIGDLTRRQLDSMIARHGVEEIVAAYREVVKDRYMAIVRRNPPQARFLRGWLNRAERLGR